MSLAERVVVIPLLVWLGCSTDRPNDTGADEVGSETAGDGDGDTTTTGDGDGDTSTTDDTTTDDTTDDTTTGDGDGDMVYDCENPMWQPEDFDYVLDVGPGLEFETPSDVDWGSIYADTLIRIHWRAEPYRDKWFLNRGGGGNAPIVILGVPQDGLLPMISGDGAVSRPDLDYWNQDRAVIKIGKFSARDDKDPGGIWIECLDIGHAKPGYFFTNAGGQQQEYAPNAAAIFAEIAHDFHVRNCELHDAGNGLVTAEQTQNVLISGNYIHDNGIVDSIDEHNSYTESRGITFEFNHYGPLCAGCLGNNLEDRSAGIVIRYNWIEDGNHQLDLVDSDYPGILADPRYATTFVYGNVFVEPDGPSSGPIIHYGGDSGNEDSYRKGILHFYHNTVVSTRLDDTTLLRLSTEAETADIRNNILYVSADPSYLAITSGSGAAVLANNWLPAGWVDTHDVLTGSVMDIGNVEGSDPGFVDEAGQDFHLVEASECVDQAGELHDDALPVERQYVVPQKSEPRLDDGAPDIGAFERGP